MPFVKLGEAVQVVWAQGRAEGNFVNCVGGIRGSGRKYRTLIVGAGAIAVPGVVILKNGGRRNPRGDRKRHEVFGSHHLPGVLEERGSRRTD